MRMPLPPPTGRGLDQDRIADLRGRGGGVLPRRQRVGEKVGDARPLRQGLGGQLVAHRGHGFGRRPDPGDAGLDHGARETRVLGQEAVARVQAVGAAGLCRHQDLPLVEVAFTSGAAAQRDRLVGLADEGLARVARGVDGNGADAHGVGRAEDAPRDLAAIRDQQCRDRSRHLRRYIRNTP